ncbi:hypothetical protein QWY75_06620 [Pontixanthobacter aestiaquae]|uniref:Uncharacterized protein n=1 Tax=Pontixanthobacter aestiaquae TaxID=1509367 RepID=A0A844Z355_9SPHN|nr:hypothetical protein [Pontixanthobacter aestiaquae]MDN3645875.1 hypothetical protein [Pontixanthobacter aestiaquae]MXO83131.1 hypothetical protein [Pontixanthobacter aestiaquae]
MTARDLTAEQRAADYFHHIDMGFLNRRLCMSALMQDGRAFYAQNARVGHDHLTRLSNDHLLVTLLLDRCDSVGAPTLIEAVGKGKPKYLFRSTHALAPCPEVYTAERVTQQVLTDIELDKPLRLSYHTEHIVSSTGKMMLAQGSDDNYLESIVGLVHDKDGRWEIEPLVMGAPWLDHPRNGKHSGDLMWLGRDFGEILAEDIDEFSNLTDVKVTSADEWMSVMRDLSEEDVKQKIATLFAEPTKKDWGGERNDLFTAQMHVLGGRRTAAFLLKGPTNFREMTLDMCGKRADQVLRLTESGADISVVQHSHQIGEAVRSTLRQLTVTPGRAKKYCTIDGQTTYRILKANKLL